MLYCLGDWSTSTPSTVGSVDGLSVPSVRSLVTLVDTHRVYSIKCVLRGWQHLENTGSSNSALKSIHVFLHMSLSRSNDLCHFLKLMKPPFFLTLVKKKNCWLKHHLCWISID